MRDYWTAGDEGLLDGRGWGITGRPGMRDYWTAGDEGLLDGQ